MTITIRTMRPDDLPGVLALQAAAYADAGFAPEGAAVYLDRMALAPDFCLVADACDGALAGYLVSHPWHEGVPPPLDTGLGSLPDLASCWYLHDCVVAAAAQGSGLAARLHAAGREVALAHRLRTGALVAVQGAAAYWRGKGYVPRTLPGLPERLAKYGDGAVYMACVLA